MTEFKILQKITGETIHEKHPCMEEFNRFVKKHGYYDLITDEDVKDMPDNWTEWLEDHGFLEEIYTKPTYAGKWEDTEGRRKPGEVYFRCESYSGGYVVHLVDLGNVHITPTNMFTITPADGKVLIGINEAFRDNSGTFRRSDRSHAPIYIEGYHIDNLLRLARKYREEATETQEERPSQPPTNHKTTN